MTEEEYLKTVSIVLQRLFDASPRYVDIFYILKDITELDDTPPKNEVMHLSQKICDKLDHENIALNDNGGYKLKISQLGIDIIESGGYLAYLDRLRNQALYDSQIQQATDDKLFTDLTIAKWQKKTFWYLFIGSILSLLFSIFSTIQSSSTQQQLENTEKRIDSMQKTVIHLDQKLLKVVSDTTKRF